MLGWAGLSVLERWQLVYYTKSLSPRFTREQAPEPLPVGDYPSVTPEGLALGRDIYVKAKYWECHGPEGKGDGPSALTLRDDWGRRIEAADLRHGRYYKGGSATQDIYRTLATGMDGTPMPSYLESLGEQNLWALAVYVRSLIVN